MRAFYAVFRLCIAIELNVKLDPANGNCGEFNQYFAAAKVCLKSGNCVLYYRPSFVIK